jgi:sugar phosphate isomerase/epimerase
VHLPFGVSQYTTWPLTLAQDLKLYAEVGLEYIEVCEAKLDPNAPHAGLESLRASGLKVSSVQPRYHSPFPNSLRPEPKSPSERMSRLSESVRLFGRYFPGTTLVVNTGLAPEGDLASYYRTAVREFKRIARLAASQGVRIGFEPLNPVYMNTDTFICSLARAAQLIDAVDHPQFGLFLDVWHYWEDPAAKTWIRKYGEKIFGVHVSDWRTPRAFGDRLLPGAGEIPLAGLLGDIRKAGYEGIYTLEIFSDLRLRDSLWANPRRTVGRGRTGFARIWRQVRAAGTGRRGRGRHVALG